MFEESVKFSLVFDFKIFWKFIIQSFHTEL